jgi:outer membrane cobalamin receptor
MVTVRSPIFWKASAASGARGDSNSRILVPIAGHQINDNVFGQPYPGAEFLVDLIECVKIIRGPSSSLYGADAFLAVINVITREPRQLKGVELSTAIGSTFVALSASSVIRALYAQDEFATTNTSASASNRRPYRLIPA